LADGEVQPFRLGRRGRLLAGAGVVVLAAAAMTAWLLRAPNRALGRPVTASSPGGYGTTAQGAVDGIHYGWLGYHSGWGKQWWSVDLGRPHALERVVVYGRASCCFNQSIPLALDISLDGKDYREIARRDEPFSQFDPWEIRKLAADARFVRLRLLRDSYLVLGEVEVYGQPK